MALENQSKKFYSNDSYYNDSRDTFAMSQARQANAFVDELNEQLEAKAAAKAAMAASQEKGTNLLRLTKSRALKRLNDGI